MIYVDRSEEFTASGRSLVTDPITDRDPGDEHPEDDGDDEPETIGDWW